MPEFEAPYTDVRVATADLSNWIFEAFLRLPRLVSINFAAPASGPELELTFGTPVGEEPEAEEDVLRSVEEGFKLSALACRRREEEDRLADERQALARGNDSPIESAVYYMQHILDRDVPGVDVRHALVVVELEETPGARTIFTASDLDIGRAQVQGMFYDCLRAFALQVGRVEGPQIPPPVPPLRIRLANWLKGKS